MSFFNPDIYNEKNLEKDDAQSISDIRYVLRCLDNEDIIDDYCSQRSMGKLETELMKERLNSYTEFIKDHLEENITELIVTMIEGYDEETFEKNIRRNYEGKEIKEGD